jgi:NTP pyrophosphatase (non-canonical NTP hydrolase)
MKYKDKNLYMDAINTFGADLQKVVAIEECSELIKELTKALRGKGNFDNLSEEIADVEIMLEQIKLIYDNQERVNYYIMKKNSRIAYMIEDCKKYIRDIKGAQNVNNCE